MRLLQATIPDTADMVFAGDFHEGAQASHTSGIRSLVRWIKAKPYRYLCHMGDGIEAIALTDPRFNPSTVARYTKIYYGEDMEQGDEIPTPVAQAMAHAEMFKPIADRVLFWLVGNHEAKLSRYGNLTRLMLSPNILNRPDRYGGRACKLRVNDTDGNQMFKIYGAHPSRVTIRSNAKDYEQQQANMKAALKRHLVHKAADCLIMALPHTHLLLLCPPANRLIMGDDGERLRQKYLGQGDGGADYIEPDRRWYINTGSFLKTQEIGIDTYAEEAFYDPVEMGYPVAKVRGRKLVDIVRKTV